MTTSITPVDAANIRPGTTGTVALDKELLMSYLALTNGTLYITTAKGFDNSDAAGVDMCFAPWQFTAPQRQLRLAKAKTTAGVPLTASAAAGVFGVSRTAGTSLVLTGEATSTNTKTDSALWEFDLPDTYVAGSAIQVVVNCNYTGSGTILPGSTAVSTKFETESVAGVEALILSSAAQSVTGTAADYTITAITAAEAVTAGLVPGSRVALVVALSVSTASPGSGSITGQINSVRYIA
jgi:hypothetical protein